MSTNRIRVLLVSLLAVFAIGAVAAGSASGAVRVWKSCEKVTAGTGQFEKNTCEGAAGTKEWKIVELIAGKTKAVTTLKNTPYTLKSAVGGAEVLIKCTTEKGEVEKINGGAPGTDEAKTLKFSGCVVEKPLKCVVRSSEPLGEVGTIETKELKSVLVENPTKTKVEELFEPKAIGGNFVVVEFKNKGLEECVLKNKVFPIEGTVVAEISNSKVFQIKATITAEATGSKKYINAAGEEKEAKLSLGPLNPATLKGTTEVELVSKEAFGGF